jgi:hypothetical protein
MNLRFILFMALFCFAQNNCVAQRQDTTLFINNVAKGRTITAAEVNLLKVLKHHDSTVEIVSFSVTCSGRNGMYFASNKGSAFGQYVLEVISTAAPGSILAFDHIVVKTEGKETKAVPVIIRVI